MNDRNYFTKGSIIIGTLKDRVSAKTDIFFKPPSNARKVLADPYEATSFVTNEGEDSLKKYVSEVTSKNLIGIIDENLRIRLPPVRYEKIKNFKSNTEWIDILNSVYVIIRALKPSIIVETGVGEIGMTTTYILAGLEENRNGVLFSIDTDKFFDIYGYHVGAGVPDNFKGMHNLIRGKSQLVMESVLKEVGSIDIFLHDGDHRYKTKLFEYELAHKYMKEHGAILSDDTWDSAFDFFVDKYKILGWSIRYGNGGWFSYSYF